MQEIPLIRGICKGSAIKDQVWFMSRGLISGVNPIAYAGGAPSSGAGAEEIGEIAGLLEVDYLTTRHKLSLLLCMNLAYLGYPALMIFPALMQSVQARIRFTVLPMRARMV